MRVYTPRSFLVLRVCWIVATLGVSASGVHGQTSADPTTIYSFPGTVGGGTGLRDPRAGLTVGPDGNMYGNCAACGDFNVGALYRVSAQGVVSVLASFDGTNGANLQAPVVFGTNGHVYGIAFQGGPSGQYGLGTIYRYTTNGALTTLVSFQSTPYGTDPTSLILNTNDNFFYGTCARFGTPQPGAIGPGGTVFKMNHAGVVTPLHTFNPNGDGYSPNSLVLGPAGIIYGANTYYVFKVSAAGAVTPYVGFSNNVTGTQPTLYACGADGALYGSTRYGSNVMGTIFRITSNGVLQTLQASIPLPIGALEPLTGIATSPLGLYGTTLAGGQSGHGDIFRISSTGKVISFVSFHAGFRQTNGWAPSALVYHPSGDFYGTTRAGGTNDQGTIFRLRSAPTHMSNAGLNAGRVGFSWASISGQTYQVQARSNVTGANWTTVTNQVATNSVSTFNEPATNAAQRFYRLLVE